METSDRGLGVQILFSQDAQFLSIKVLRILGCHYSVLRPPFPGPVAYPAPGPQAHSQPPAPGPRSRPLPSPPSSFCSLLAHLFPGDLLSEPSGHTNPLPPVLTCSHGELSKTVLYLSHLSSPAHSRCPANGHSFHSDLLGTL